MQMLVQTVVLLLGRSSSCLVVVDFGSNRRLLEQVSASWLDLVRHVKIMSDGGENEPSIK